MSSPILPTEILHEIGPYLSVHDVPNLRIACTLFSQVFAPFAANSLMLDVNTVVFKSVRKRTDRGGTDASFAPTPTSLVPFIRSLKIRLDCHEQDSRPRLLPIIHQEIARLKSLRMLTIQWLDSALIDLVIAQMRIDEEGLLFAAFQASGGALEHVKLSRSYLYPRLSTSPSLLPVLLSLKQLEFGAGKDGDLTAFMSQLREILARGASLHALSVNARGMLDFGVPINRGLFPSRSVVPHLPIRTLRLHGRLDWHPESDITNLPSFSNLTHLVLFPTSLLSVHLDGFWECLKTSGVRLQHLDVYDYITSALASYLTSFSGLKELLLGTTPAQPSNIQLRRLIPALVHHASTLENLMLRESAYFHALPETDESQSPVVWLWPSPSLFVKLKYFYIHIPQFLSSAVCQNMLNWLEQFPALEGAYTEWQTDIDWWIIGWTASEPRSMERDFEAVRPSLVGRAGRPRYWGHRETGEYSDTSLWKIRSQSPNEWCFEALDDHSGVDIKWWSRP